MSALPDLRVAASLLGGGGVVPEPPRTFELTVAGFAPRAFTVASFRGTEAMSRLFSFDVRALYSGDGALLDGRVLGRRAQLSLSAVHGALRVVSGVLTAVTHVGMHVGSGDSVYQFRLAPTLWRLKRRTNSRIFQEQTIVEIADVVLAELGVERRWAVARKLPCRSSCVQYQESDYAFLTRLFAEEGIFFYFEDPREPAVDGAFEHASSETLVLCDEPRAYPSIPRGPSDIALNAARPPTLPFRQQGGNVTDEDYVSRFEARRRASSTSVALNDYDFKRPNLALTARSAAPDAERLDCGPHPDRMEIYDHHAEFEETDVNAAHANVHLEQHRGRAWVATGESTCRSLSPARRFQLLEHQEPSLDKEYVATRVLHRGVVPELVPGEGDKRIAVYLNTFECVPATVTFRPKRPRRSLKQVVETAVVVGPPGEEIHTDEFGRIKVQFHWDRAARSGGASSCWIRPTQAWSGAGWGSQFIPRVGMEVLVTFVGGDEDRPVVIGCLYNGVHPVPFKLPKDKTRSGIRTQSSPGGGGFNEVSFEDAAGREQLYLRAQRDLDEVALRDHTLRVGRDESLHVGRDQRQTIDRDQTETVRGNRSDTVELDWTTEVHGHRRETVKGNRDLRVVSDLTTHVEGRENRFVDDDVHMTARSDLRTEVRGNMVTVVGRSDAKRSALLHVDGSNELSSTGTTEIRADKNIVIRCGESSIRITPKSIEIASPTVILRGKKVLTSADKVKTKAKRSVVISSDQVGIKGSGSSLALTQTAKLAASQVDLGSNPDAMDDEIEDAKPITPTTFAVHDQHANPVPHQPFVLVMADGSERTGVVDEAGVADLDLEQSGTIVFPELQKADPGPMKPYAIRQGDYLTQLAARYGFDADTVWADAKNADLRKRRKEMNILLPGDIVFLPEPEPKKVPFHARTSNTFDVVVPTVKIELTLSQGEAIAGEPYTVEGVSPPIKGTTDEKGRAAFDLPIHIRSVRLVIPSKNIVMPILVGDLDPIEEMTGVRMRLEHLGFFGDYRGGGESAPVEARDRWAIEAFQRTEKLPVTGEMDPDTIAALKRAHGS